MMRLVELIDSDFDWMSGGLRPRIPELTLPPGGVDSPLRFRKNFHVRPIAPILKLSGPHLNRFPSTAPGARQSMG